MRDRGAIEGHGKLKATPFLALRIQRGLSTPEQQKNRWTDARNALKTLNSNHPALEIGINAKARYGLHERQTKSTGDRLRIAERAVDLLNSRSLVGGNFGRSRFNGTAL